jgi:uncharacterized protein (TIGR00255 family)
MTGFGRAREVLHGRELTVEVKSVNSRYFEYASRLPRSLSFVDDLLKKAVSSVVRRGKVEVHLGVQAIDAAEVMITANLPAARGYYEALADIARDLRLENNITANSFTHISDVFSLRRGEADEDELGRDILQVAAEALRRCDAMRAAEGQSLLNDITARIEWLETAVGEVEKGSQGRVRRYVQRLEERLREVLADTAIDEARILAEAAIFADRTAVDEESVRLRSHLTQYREILASQEQMGRKLDFLTQELNREINTIGSKCQEVEITRLVVDMKAEVEKIREQIQNLE